MIPMRPVGPLAETVGRILERTWHLPPRRHRVGVVTDLEVPMRDGVLLRTDRYGPTVPGVFPTLLVRTPYGRGPGAAWFQAQLYAERGYHVIVQSVRGTFGSGGVFEPGVAERDDALDTVAWLRGQPFFDGRLGTIGASYLGYTQWALAADPPPELQAMVATAAVHDLSGVVREQGPIELYNTAMWTEMIAHQESHGFARGLHRLRTVERRIAPALDLLPISSIAAALGGTPQPWADEWLRHPDPDDPRRARTRMTDALERSTVPALLIGGWQDVFLHQELTQYAALSARGVEVELLMGPWTHFTFDSTIVHPRALAFLDRHLRGATTPRPPAVTVHVGGADRWEDHAAWPPADLAERTWFVGPGALVDDAPAADAAAAEFLFDPAEPTPSVGGRIMGFTGGRRDNRELAARADVLTVVSAPLTAPVELRGAPVVRLRTSADRPDADLFVRLTDVEPSGRALTVADGVLRTEGAPVGETRDARIALDPAAHRFEVGHRLGLLVAGGAHPRFATAADLDLAEPPPPVRQRVLHDAAHPSTVVLPVLRAPRRGLRPAPAG